jgi:ribosomal protein L11 methyltransferase
MSNNFYQKMIVRLSPKCEDLWIAHCFEHNASGIETTEENSSYITMATYFNDMSIQMQVIFDIFCKQCMMDSRDIHLLCLETHSNKNWLEAWKIHFHPIHITDQFIVCPPWDVPKTDQDKKIVLINPGNGFGSGSHPTTVLALKLLIALMENKTHKLSILDVGTGSGILLIAAKLLGANKLVGIDIDYPSIIDAQRNYQLNQLDNIIFVCGSPQCIHYSFDIVISNMMLHELQSVQIDLVRNIGQSGVLILSGFYLSQKEKIIECFRDFQVVLEINDGRWGGYAMKRT